MVIVSSQLVVGTALAHASFAEIVAVPPAFITWKQLRPLSQPKRIRVPV